MVVGEQIYTQRNEEHTMYGLYGNFIDMKFIYHVFPFHSIEIDFDANTQRARTQNPHTKSDAYSNSFQR